jgi:hypothetical protein
MLASRSLFLTFALFAGLGVGLAGEMSMPTQAKPAPSATPSAKPRSENDAEKHVRRTACLKDARARKLAGAQRTAYVHSCLDSTST